MTHTFLRTVAVILGLSIVPTAYGAYGLESQSAQEPLIKQSTNRMGHGSDQIVEGSKVTLQYVATAYGTRVTDYGDISEFIQGAHEIFPALERELVGMKAGEEKKVALSLSFPLFFVFHRAGFMLPGFPRVEPDATHPETASVTGSLASSVV
ncbi:MAG: FKBP-type peptidyl-prolyl cis-trans isomerase, partial [Nitrospirales bacterium]